MQDVAHAAVIDILSTHFAGTIGAEGEHDSIDTVHRAWQRVRTGDVTGDHLCLMRKLAGLAGAAHQGTHDVALQQCLLDDEAPNAAGRTNNQHGHAGNSHNVSL